jgi:hypothetical protein
MNTLISRKLNLTAFLSIVLLLITSCASQIKLTGSWANKQAKVKRAPVILVMVLGKPNSEVRQDIENKIVARLTKDGFKAVPGSTLFKPGVSKRDSAEVVNTLRKNNIDLLLTNAVISKSEENRFIPGTLQGNDIAVPGSGAAAAAGSYNGVTLYSNYYNYYNYYNGSNSYQVIEAPKAMGTTVTDVYIVIESNLYEVATPELIWHGLSSSTTKDPTPHEINTFTKSVISEIKKNNLLIK